jgi:hypothetical protein
MDFESFTVPIAFEGQQASASEDWDRVLEHTEALEPLQTMPEAYSSQRLDRLLWWCSAAGSGDLALLRAACGALQVGTTGGDTWSVLRRMTLLGHIEFTRTGGWKWGVAEPVMVLKPGSDGTYFLAGQRTPSMIDILCPGANTLNQHDAPSRIEFQHDGEEIDLPWGRTVRNVGCIAGILANALPTVEDWMQALPVWDEKDFARYQAEMYSTEIDSFVHATVLRDPHPGFYRFALTGVAREMSVLSFYDHQNGRWVRGDFYGLRFLARRLMGQCRAGWQAKSGELLMPVSDRWPMPYERALVLASGLLPDRRRGPTGMDVLCYRELTEDLVQKLCGKLGIGCQVADE